MDIYKAKIIDAQGKFLKDPEDYTTEKERMAGSTFNRLIVVLKRALLTSSDPKIRYTLTNPMATLNALAEEVESFGGDGDRFMTYVLPLFEEGMAIAGGQIAGLSDTIGAQEDKTKQGNIVVPKSAARRHRKRVEAGAPHIGRAILEQLLNEAKKKTEKQVVETTGHMMHLGDYLYHGDPNRAFEHLNAVHGRFHGQDNPDHKMSLKADGGMSIVLMRHANGEHAVVYKTGKNVFTTEQQIEDFAKQNNKPHLVKNLIPALHLVRKMNLKPGTAVQGDLLFTETHEGTIQPNTITYKAPTDADVGFAPHSQYKIEGNNLLKTSSHPDHSMMDTAGAYIPHLAIHKGTHLSMTPEVHKQVSQSIKAAQKALSQKGTIDFLKTLPSNKHFHKMLQEYSNHAARTSGKRTVEGLMKFIPVHMKKKTQAKLTPKTKKARTESFRSFIRDNAHHFGAAFEAHGHINDAKHAILNQFAQHAGQFDLQTHAGEEHEGLVSSLGTPGATETQAKLVREGPGGFPAKNQENSIKRFGKPPEA